MGLELIKATDLNERLREKGVEKYVTVQKNLWSCKRRKTSKRNTHKNMESTSKSKRLPNRTGRTKQRTIRIRKRIGEKY